MVKRSIAVYQDQNYFAAVEVEGNQLRAEVIRYLVERIPETGVTSEWIQGLWKKGRFSHNKVVGVLPTEMVRYRFLQYPDLQPEQLQAAIKLEMSALSADELYQIISISKHENQNQVKIGLVSQEQLNLYGKIFSESGLVVEWYGLKTAGFKHFLKYHADFFEDESTWAYLDLEHANTEFGLIAKDEVVYLRNLDIGAEQLKSEPHADSDLLEELRLSAAVSKETVVPNGPAHLWLFGDWDDDRDGSFIEKLPIELGLIPHLAEKTRLSGVLTGKITPLLAPLIGTALNDIGWENREDLRLFTREQEQKRATQRNLVFLGKIAGAGILAGVGILLFFQAQSLRNNKDALWVNQQAELVGKLKKVETLTHQKLNQLDEMNRWLSLRGRELEFLRVLEANLPDRTEISDISIEDGVIKNLSGSTPSVSLLLDVLKRSPELRNFKLKGSITTEKDGREHFQLEGKIESAARK